MAYLDDNNDNLYTQGDPLEALDRELAELKASLEELDALNPLPFGAANPNKSDAAAPGEDNSAP